MLFLKQLINRFKEIKWGDSDQKWKMDNGKRVKGETKKWKKSSEFQKSWKFFGEYPVITELMRKSTYKVDMYHDHSWLCFSLDDTIMQNVKPNSKFA